MAQPLEEAIVNIHSPESDLNPVRKRSASLNIVGFSNAVEMDLSLTRVSKSAEVQAKEISSVTSEPFQSMPKTTDGTLEDVPGCSLSLDRTINGISPDPTDHVTTSSLPLVTSVCKLESEEFGSTRYSLGSDSTGTKSKSTSELPFPMHNILEEPINLSVKKTQPCVSPPILISNTASLQSVYPESRHIEDHHNCEEEHVEVEIKSNQNNRVHAKEVKIPYVRLERLKICTSESGEFPVFKLQPQKNQHDGTFLLIIECGSQSSSMCIKVNQGNPPDRMNLNPSSENLEEKRIPTNQVTEQVSVPSVDQRLTSSGMKKSGLTQKEKQPIENEDFCAVCLNGGELLCCDYCPKVFHLSCHIPALLSFPVGEWVCTLCRNVENPEVDYDCENTRFSYGNKLIPERALYGLNSCDQKKCEKLVLSLFCSNLSLPFHEPVSPLARHYYQIIKRPMDLSTIRKKLLKKNKFHYSTSEELVADVRLMFWNCATFNYPDSEVAEAGRCLEIFFESKLKDVYPEKQFYSRVKEDDSDSEEVDHEQNKAAPKGFQWPSYRQECIQPKRRRRNADSEKTKKPIFWPAKGLSQV
ncbi:hypothetical protein JRQ81_000388 [Phrynocephalus forsythii]|uniref:Tripartite motif-containing protein 66 n=1 Tax=Phrynocephalus forsythii TaxID=171643 RepID=A0A9Q0Y618_9SAUR|nr:hypothetical protein JRQ81_000388 [Phrynocephalus forsythii]